MRIVVAYALMIGLLQGQTGKSEIQGCNLKIVDECFKFKGRVSLHNGGHGAWIWHVGRDHRYWVENEIALTDQKIDWDHYYWGEFYACPTTKFREGSAQGICAKAIGKLKATKRKD